jgi:citrate synthase
MEDQWISAEEAQARLGVKRQTLYAYASRGLIANRIDGLNSRRSLYAAEDIARLALQKDRPKAAQTPKRHNVQPLRAFSSTLTLVSNGRLYYLGHDAVALAESAAFEDVARLLWRCEDDPFLSLAPHPQVATGPDTITRAFSLFAYRAARDPAAHGRPTADLKREAASLLTDLIDAVAGRAQSGPLHERLARAWRVDAAKGDVIRRALVLAMDHEPGPSTVAVRIAASTGASLAAVLAAGLATLSGPLHGGTTSEVAAFVLEARRKSDPFAVARDRLAKGLDVPGFGHPSHPEGDPRAAALAEAMPWSEDIQEIARAGQIVTGQSPNLDFALVATARTLGLPSDAAGTLKIAARAAGWLGHALDQRASDAPMNSRVRYVGPEPGAIGRRRFNAA